MRSLTVVGIIMFWGLSASSQTYHFPSTVELFTKTTDFGTVHGYLEVVNDSGDTVPMRWISRWESTCPPEWVFNFDDQNNFYTPVLDGDSADFNLLPPGTYLQKMIIGMGHNDKVGSGSIYFTIFPLHDRSDSTRIEYNFTITQGVNDTNDTNGGPIDTTDSSIAIGQVEWEQWMDIRWHDQLTIHPQKHMEHLQLFDLHGRLLLETDRVYPQRVLIIDPRATALIVMVQLPDGSMRWKKLAKH